MIGVLRREVSVTWPALRRRARAAALLGALAAPAAAQDPVPAPSPTDEIVERDFAGVSESETRRIVCDNAARLYGFHLDAAPAG